MIELSDELAAVEARYADLLQELAVLYQVREQIRRELASPAVARRGAAATAALDMAGEEDTAAIAAIEAIAPQRKRSRSKAKSGKNGLRVIVGGEEGAVNPAQRLAQKQGTRALLRVLGEAAS